MVLEEFEESLVKIWIAGESLPGESIDFQRSFSFIVKLEVGIDSEILEVGPDGASFVILGSFFVEGKEPIKCKQTILVVIILSIE